ncbi:MAG TPA: peptidylprolyl isomerase [Anaerolineales bacterium]|nr:peptidylprolyl isomerase [Anaerolineales bacterium]
MSEQLKVDDGQVVSIHYTLRVDGQVVDSSDGREPLQFIQGMGHIVRGLEHELYDMKIGESKDIVVAPKDGYGEVNAEAIFEVPRAEFPPNVPMQVGTGLELRDEHDNPMYAVIDRVDDQNVRLNMNHPLAGKELHFSVQIANLRPASGEEVSHGHVHGGDQGH